MSTETQEKTKKNTQAIASLILGLISIVFALFNYVPGILSALGFVGSVAALLAILAGVRGLLAARGIDKQGRNLAIAGIAAGGLGLLLFIITFIFPIKRDVEESLALLTPQPPQTFQGEGFTVTYPSGWEQATDAYAGNDFCKQPGVECLLAIIHPSRDGTNINLMRFALEEEATVEEIDQILWEQFESVTPDVNLESRDTIDVGGQPAVRRVFSTPSSEASGGRVHLLQVYIVKGPFLYQFTGWTPNADSFTQHRAAIEEIITGMQFSP